MAKKLFVGNLSYNMTDDQLNAIFAAFGTVISANIVFDKFSHRSKGFGFVEFVDEANNQKAVDELNGKELDGRPIVVNISEPREDRPKRDFGGDRGGFRGGNQGGGFRGGDRGGDRGGFKSFRSNNR